MFTQSGVGKQISGKIVVFSKDKITVDGKEISTEEADKLKEDSRQKLLAALAARQAYRAQEEKYKKYRDLLRQSDGGKSRKNSCEKKTKS